VYREPIMIFVNLIFILQPVIDRKGTIK